eukprot:4498335-Prymnesium_polylepis.1
MQNLRRGGFTTHGFGSANSIACGIDSEKPSHHPREATAATARRVLLGAPLGCAAQRESWDMRRTRVLYALCIVVAGSDPFKIPADCPALQAAGALECCWRTPDYWASREHLITHSKDQPGRTLSAESGNRVPEGQPTPPTSPPAFDGVIAGSITSRQY